MSLKRSGPLERRTPLRARAPMKRAAKPMKKAWMKRKPPRRLARRAAHAPYLAFVRSLNCISCGSKKPSDAAHMPTGESGVGLKGSDRDTAPLCRSCHRWFDGHTNPVIPREERRALAKRWLAAMELAVTPDNIDHARDLEAEGLGRIVRDGFDWTWLPADVDDNEQGRAA